MKTLTLKQQQTLAAVREHRRTHGQSPTVRELAALLGVQSTCTVQRHVDALEKKGFIHRPGRYRHRCIVPVGDVPLPSRLDLLEATLREIHSRCQSRSEEEWPHLLRVDIPDLCETALPELRTEADWFPVEEVAA